MKLGDAYFYDGKYNEAALAYEEFVRLHPRNEVVPYVLYQYGMCHFLNFSAIDRDPSETDQAVEAFKRVVQNYPGSEYAKRAQKQLFECEKRIVAHEYEVGKFYYGLDKYPSAKIRLDNILKNYPAAAKDLGYKESAEEMLAECEKQIAKGEQKPSVWVRMGF
jgi:outer membrane protein assembly factor BamD